jgi:hypothetical protein
MDARYSERREEKRKAEWCGSTDEDVLEGQEREVECLPDRDFRGKMQP